MKTNGRADMWNDFLRGRFFRVGFSRALEGKVA